MNQLFTIYSAIFLLTSGISFLVAILAWQRRRVKTAMELFFLMCFAGIWTFFVMFETAATTLNNKILWSQLAYLGAVSTPVLYLLFVLRFTGKDRLVKPWSVILLFVIPVITLLLTFTNHLHYLVWPGFSEISPHTNMLEYYHGPWFWIGYLAYNYILLFASTVLLFQYILSKPKAFRKQGWVVLIAGVFPWLASIFYLSRINIVPGLDLVPVSFIISGSLFVYAILYFGFLDLVPVARETLVETLWDGIVALDDQDRILDINEAANQFLGIPYRNNVGFYIELSGATQLELLIAVMTHEPVEQINIGDKTFNIIKKPIKSLPGSRLILIRDITEQIIRQNEIIVSEKKYRNMFSMFRLMMDNMSDLLWAKDLNKRFIFTNKAICEKLLMANDTHEPIQKTDLFFAERERKNNPENPYWHTFGEMCQDSDQLVLDTQSPHQFDEFGNVRGQFLYLDVQKAPIFDENGDMIGVVGSARDVTVQKKHEQALLHKDKLLEAISRATALLIKAENFDENIQSALAIIGEVTGANRVYIFSNSESPEYSMPLMSQIYEWTDGKVEPQINNSELQNVPYELACPRWCRILSAGKSVAGHVRDFPELERQGLEPQNIKSILATPITIDGYFWGFMGFDACLEEREWTPTEQLLLSAASNSIGAAILRKRNQDELVAAKEKAQESDRLKSAFLDNISHEIRTPVNGILGFLNLIREEELAPEERDQYIDLINTSSERLLNLISDIIDISIVQSGQLKLTHEITSVPEILTAVFKEFKDLADRKKIDFNLNTHLPQDEGILITDPEKLSLIIRKLTGNAIKFTVHGSVSIDAAEDHGYLLITVTDTGVGISKEQQGRLFNKFTQADLSHSRPYEGMGLGLALAKAYTDALNGEIWFESQPGEGTVFFLKIPCNQKKTEIINPGKKAPANNSSPSKKLRILIAEDDDVSFKYLSMVLSHFGPDMIRTSTGQEALEIFRITSQFDLILMDIKMPEMDGLTAIREIRKTDSEIPVIVISAYALKGDREKALEAGCNEYLSKPVKPEEILDVISRYLV